MTVKETAMVLGTQEQFVRCAMQTGRLDIGACAKVGKKKQRYAYVVVPEKLAKYMEITVEELNKRMGELNVLRQNELNA